MPGFENENCYQKTQTILYIKILIQTKNSKINASSELIMSQLALLCWNRDHMTLWRARLVWSNRIAQANRWSRQRWRTLHRRRWWESRASFCTGQCFQIFGKLSELGTGDNCPALKRRRGKFLCLKNNFSFS